MAIAFGHVKSICLNFGLAAEFGGLVLLRFDDTNPSKEGIDMLIHQEDVRWLGFDCMIGNFTRQIIERLSEFALQLISGKAFVRDSRSRINMCEYFGEL